jgi:hypothetical protein
VVVGAGAGIVVGGTVVGTTVGTWARGAVVEGTVMCVAGGVADLLDVRCVFNFTV